MIAAVPVVVVTVLAVTGDWLPMGDNAYFPIRAADVGTTHHPLIGAWSSGSMSVGVDVNNLGPMQFDLLALPVRVGWINGTAIGVAAMNIAAIATACFAARRVAGALGSLVVATGAAALCWTLGTQLHEPQQHSAMVLAAFAFTVLVWAMVAGDLRSLPWAIGVASLLVQTHLTYLTSIPILGVGAAVVCWVGWRRRTRSEEAPSTVRGVVVASVVVTVLCWAQPLLDQFAGRGNLGNVASAAGAGPESAGFTHGLRSVAEVVALPPWWFPSSYRDFDPNALGSLGVAVFALVLVGLLLGGSGVLAHRSDDRVGVAAIATSGAVLALALVSATSQVPTGDFGLVAGNYRWLWAAAAWVWVSVAVVVARVLAVRLADATRRRRSGDTRVEDASRAPVRIGFAVLVLVAAVASLPGARADLVASHEPLVPVARDLIAQLGPLEDLDLIEIDRRGMLFGEPYSYVVMAHLQARGVAFETVLDIDVLRFGSGREPTGDAAGTIRFANGNDALDAAPGEQRIAFATGFDEDDLAELEHLRALPDPSQEEAALLGGIEARWRVSTVGVFFHPGADAEAAG
ncbi:hypothetical protein [Actinospongicola halichondriae]|uniref:hypothetical protein n=1 Tax=Actinospongicola halichondriae TaxID=3236844 RepID=UPI003D3BF26D